MSDLKYNTLVVPVWALALPWIRDHIADEVDFDVESIIQGAPMGGAGWLVAHPSSADEIWRVDGDMFIVCAAGYRFNAQQLSETLGADCIPHDVYFGDDAPIWGCADEPGAVASGLSFRSAGLATVEVFDLPDSRLVERWSEARLIDLLKDGRSDEVLLHLQEVVEGRRAIPALGAETSSPREGLVCSFWGFVAGAVSAEDVDRYFGLCPAACEIVTPEEMDKALAILCTHGSVRTLAALCARGLEISDQRLKRVFGLVERFASEHEELKDDVVAALRARAAHFVATHDGLVGLTVSAGLPAP